ncbi:hypothetical protein [Aliivibrio logei]|uniref:hypothetical protein n=1 Tax=Aliivibrio logei TaxID=688 RepID=UPI0035C91DDC
MKYFKTLLLLAVFFHYSVNANPLEQQVSIGKYASVLLSLDNYNDDGEPVCELKIVTEEKTSTKYMFDACANLNVKKLNDKLFKLQVNNDRGNRKKIVFINSKLIVLGVLAGDLSSEDLDVLENNFNNKVCFVDIEPSDLKLLEKFVL